MKANSLKTKISPRRRGADEVAAEPGQRDHELALVNPYPRKRLRRQIQRPDWIVGAARVIDSVRQAPCNGRISLRTLLLFRLPSSADWGPSQQIQSQSFGHSETRSGAFVVILWDR